MRRISFVLAVSCCVFAGLSAPAVEPALAQQSGSGQSASGQSASGQTFSGMKLSNDKPIQIESDKLEVHDKDNTAIFTGNVNVVQGTTLMKAGRMVVYYIKGANGTTEGGKTESAVGSTIGGGSSNIKSIDVDGKVYVKSDNQIATGDHGTFDMQSQVLVLEGDQVVLTQGDNVVIGCKLTANLKTGLSNLDGCGSGGKGRVKVLLTPQKKTTK